MGHQYVKNYVINTIDFDENRHLRAITIINFLQDISTCHYNWALAQNQVEDDDGLWVIVEWDVEIVRYPSRTQTLSVMTEPVYFRKFIGHRRYEIKNDQGELLVRGMSKWAYMSASKRAQANIPKEIYSLFGVDEKAEKPPKLVKVKIPDVKASIDRHRVAYSDIDVNGHVNNGAYVHWLMDAIPSEFEKARYPKRLQVHYRNEMFINEEAVIEVYPDVLGDDLLLQGDYYLVAEVKGKDQVAVTCVLSW